MPRASPILAKALEPGATIAFISPSLRLNDVMSATVSRATNVLTSRGYKVRELFTRDTGIQSCIANRLSEIRTAFMDPTISAVFCTIGGSTFTELLPALLADTELHEAIRANPKIVVGYSDISGLHWFLYAVAGLRTFYGPGPICELGEASSSDEPSSALAFCVRNLFAATASREPIGDVERSLTYAPKVDACYNDPASLTPPDLLPSPAWTWLRGGKAQGRLFGGCLTVVARLAGVQAIVPDWRSRIVFLETAAGDDDSGNPLPRVQAGFADLIAQGVFEEAAGLVVGRPFGYRAEAALAKYAGVITGLLCEGRLAAKNPFPILFNIDIGHTTPMVTLPFDALAELDSSKDRFAILESGVA
ncbi:peptidase u61 ld-carboxypeptidase a [Lasiosphaeria miniovina]|uniref:Peptidase u61 ld-carboxypeptidase a n=1 Tax=Lasiosphaeria miniovina TaxID=1954250 RepID=A0AA40DTN2_9PEZI|nr:peptidase u61 ld-carboxypeptidase a [Lasiosphaeria miniovina]KAK0712942.1 peptidase u61 ld-carboxypeptidase a [Lasiosphaeria miniovina]